MEPERILQIKFDLGPEQAKILRLLAENRVVSSRDFFTAGVHGDIKVAIFRLRKKLEDQKFLGKEIKIFSKRLLGYWMADDIRKDILEIVKEEKFELPGGGPGNASVFG